MPIEKLIVRLKREYPDWGAPKIRERLRHRYPAVHCPAISTVHAVLDRHGLVKKTKRRSRAKGTALSWPAQPNELWCADYTGEFMLAGRQYCYPLTISDFASRSLIRCEALSTTRESTRLPCLNGCSRILACRGRFAPTTACPSRVPMPSMA